MLRFLEQLTIALWNLLQGRRARRRNGNGGETLLGYRVLDERTTDRRIGMSATRRAMHTAVVGKSGTGKTSLIKALCAQDVEAGRGMFVLDLHGDITPFILSAIAAEEWRRQEHLSDRLIVISPADRELSVGLNPLEDSDPDFARIAEFAEVLRQRWNLDHFGARTDELLRNVLYVLSASGLTLLEAGPLLTSGADPWLEGCVPPVRENGKSYTDLLNRSRARFARPRAEIEREIVARRESLRTSSQGDLHDWD